MKTAQWKLWAMLFALPMLATLHSCQKEEELAAPETKSVDAYEMPGYEAVENPEITMADENSEFAIADDGMPEMDLDAMQNLKPAALLTLDSTRCNRRALLDSLNLDTAQLRKLHRAAMARHRCVKAVYVKIRIHNAKVIKRFNLALAGLKQDLRDSTITPAQFRIKVTVLHKKAREALINDQDRRRVLLALKKCHRQFLANVKGILTPAQWHIWVKFHKRCLNQ